MPDPNAGGSSEVNINLEIIANVMNKTQSAFRLLLSDLYELKRAHRELTNSYSMPLKRFFCKP